MDSQPEKDCIIIVTANTSNRVIEITYCVFLDSYDMEFRYILSQYAEEGQTFLVISYRGFPWEIPIYQLYYVIGNSLKNPLATYCLVSCKALPRN